MKKLLLLLVALSVIAIATLYFIGSGLLGKGIRAGVVTFGPKVTQTPVRLDGVSLSILSGNGSLEGLYVGNPQGYKAENIFALGRIDIDVAPMSVFDDIVVINKVHIRQPEISYEKGLHGSNLKALLANIESFTGAADKAPADKPEPEPDAEGKPGKQVAIKSLIIEEGTVYVGFLGAGAKVLLPRIEMSDLGAREGGGGQSGAQMVGAIIGEILQSVSEVLAKPELVKGVGNAADSAAGALQEAGGSAAEGVKKITEGIGDLFGN